MRLSSSAAKSLASIARATALRYLSRAPCQHLLVFRFHLLLPHSEQAHARRGISISVKLRFQHTVGAEVTETLAQFAPGDDHPHGFEIADGDGPNGARRAFVFQVAIQDSNLRLLM